jgi:archaellum biogenesis ATPase FlaH
MRNEFLNMMKCLKCDLSDFIVSGEMATSSLNDA